LDREAAVNMRVNRTLRCTMCDEDSLRARQVVSPEGSRVMLGPKGPARAHTQVAFCPVHDSAGPAEDFPPGVRRAWGMA
jgi:phage-related baseplate assembly protein